MRRVLDFIETIFRKISPKNFSKILQIDSNIGQKEIVFEQYICNVKQIEKMMQKAKIEVKQMREMHLASVSSIGLQNVENAFQKVIEWGISKKLYLNDNLKMLAVYHDSFKVTPADKVRINACIMLDESIKNKNHVFPEILPSGKYIGGNFLSDLINLNRLGMVYFYG